MGVSGSFDPFALFFRLLYSFRDTDFLVDGGVAESIGGGDLRDLADGVSLTMSVIGSSRLRFGFGVVLGLSSLDLYKLVLCHDTVYSGLSL